MRHAPLKAASSVIEQHVLPLIAAQREKVAAVKRQYDLAKAELDFESLQLEKLLDATALIKKAAGGTSHVEIKARRRAADNGVGAPPGPVNGSNHSSAAAGDGSSKVPLARFVKEIIFKQVGRFTSQTIDAEVEKNYPEVHVRMPQGYVSSILWKLRKAGKILDTKTKDGNDLILYENLKK